MKQYKIISACFAVFFALLMSASGIAQQKHVVIKKTSSSESDSTETETISNFDSFKELYHRLDSLKGFGNDDVKSLFKIEGFSLDSMYKRNFGFDMDFDSLFSHNYFNEDGFEKFFDEFPSVSGSTFFFKHDFDSISKDSNVEMFIDTVKSDDGIKITKKVIVHSGGGNNNEWNDLDKNKKVIIKSSNPEGVGLEEGEVVADLSLSDIGILKLGGISDKIITSSALEPEKVNIDVNVKAKDGMVVKKVNMILSFSKEANTQVIVLNKEGAVISKETIKNQKGELKKEVIVHEEEKPYYFLVVRDVKLFSKKIQ